MFEVWTYSDNSNCWDYVRHHLKSAGVDLPKFGISPKDKKKMTLASKGLESDFIECQPVNNSIACQYFGDILFHVGIVKGGKVCHVGSKTGLRYDSINDFCKRGKVIFRIHKDLWQS